MKIAVLGAGFAGLSAAYYLKIAGHEVTVFEKDLQPGGLAVGYKEKNWEYSLEIHYHHFFTNDHELINLVKKIGISDNLIFPKSQTSVLSNGKIYPFNSPDDILSFPPLSYIDRIRLGLATVICKCIPASVGIRLEKYTAIEFANFLFGNNVTKIVWMPLLNKKFGEYANVVNASWLWARIRKRTLQLGYVKGGFQAISNKMAQKVQEMGVKIKFSTEIRQLKQTGSKWVIEFIDKRYSGGEQRGAPKLGSPCGSVNWRIGAVAKQDPNILEVYDTIISTLPSAVFLNIIPDIPLEFKNNLTKIPHLHALNLILETKEPLLADTYWLNINDEKYPFLCLVQHTNFIDKSHYGNNHLLYVGNYLPKGHPYFKKTDGELLEIYLPYLKKVNPKFSIKDQVLSIKQFIGLNAQPVFLGNYSQIRPFGQTPLKNLYFANLDSVYPWDRGTNYALELGRQIARLVNNDIKL